MLYPVPQLPGPRLYCGPTAICAVTGVHPRDAVRAVQRVRGDRAPVVGVDDYEMCAALAVLGWGFQVYNINPRPGQRRPTFGRYMQSIRPFPGSYILSLRGHYVAASYTEMVDSHTEGRVVPLLGCPHRRLAVFSIIAQRPLRRTTPRRVDPPTLSP